MKNYIFLNNIHVDRFKALCYFQKNIPDHCEYISFIL